MSNPPSPGTGPHCPQCGWPVAHVHRHAVDRWTGILRSTQRYRCTSPHCGWEGLLAAPPGAVPASATLRWRSRLLWLVLGVGLALAAVQGARLMKKAAPQPHPTWVATGGAELQSQATPAGQDFAGEALPSQDERARSNATPLALRNSCSWGVPGSNRYRGTVEQALRAAQLPSDVVQEIAEKAERGWAHEQVEISRTGIRTVDQRRNYGSTMLAMAFGNTLCFNTRVNFVPGHVEYASLYRASDRQGHRYTVIVPYVCQNVAVLGERAETEGGTEMPEPAGLALSALGLGLVAWQLRRRSLRQRRGAP